MKKIFNWQVYLGAGLILLSVLTYLLHYLLFRDLHHILIYFIGDIAFVFIEVLLVSLIIHEMLSQREKKAKLSKLNMVIGAFYSEVGKELIVLLSKSVKEREKIAGDLLVKNDWSVKDFARVAKQIKKIKAEFDSRSGDLTQLRDFLRSRRQFLLGLLENPNILEHESFTDLLWSVFHLTEELCARKKLTDLAAADYNHLSGDVNRVYLLLVSEWLDYLRHLQRDYPYLFSLELRTNPFNPNACAEIC